VIAIDKSFIDLAYLVSAVLFIGCLAGLSDQETSRRGNLYGMIGMAIAFVATILHPDVQAGAWGPIVGMILVGGAIGAVMATRVEMTAMPELVALLHSFVGAAAVLVGVGTYLGTEHIEGIAGMVHLTELFLDVLIGAVTFTGSIVAFLKLRGSISGNALRLPGRHFVNLALALLMLGLGAHFAWTGEGIGLYVTIGLASVLGVLMIHQIGGADMPVAVSLLNSYSGWTASAAGFVLGNDLLIVTGALVGSSGAILSYVMCKAMNRSIWNVVFGDWSAASAGGGDIDPALKAAVDRGVNVAAVDEAIEILRSSGEIVVVPGYGMAVAQAQNAVRELAELLEHNGARVRYAIHPVAGRLPGHMNVLLAEANVPYDAVLEMDDINADFPGTDAVLVIGANDIVNPASLEDPKSPLYGMPTLEVHKAKTVFVIKRSMAAGYSGVDNPLYYKDNTMMVFGDARKVVEEMVKKAKALAAA
jgi:NAD(P) transhydrogenase subunit beta